MFPTSTQRKHWMFADESEINQLRENANNKHVALYCANYTENKKYQHFLTPEEERMLLRKYEIHLREFCKRFQPPMPRYVVGTAFQYFKRFYIHNSVMNYHPKEIMATCVYLACKVEEFNVSISQFIANIKGDREKAADIILNNELLLMEQLNFHLAIHNPFRPVEGLLIDIKTRCSLNNPERLRPGTEDFLERVFFTDVCLLYAPSQIALAAILHAASKVQENLDSYVTDTLFGVDGQNRLADLIEAVRKIRSMVKLVDTPPPPKEQLRMLEKKLEICRNPVEAVRKIRSMVKLVDTPPPPKEQLRMLEKKLEICRNPENNPDSDIYKARLQAALDEEDEYVYAKIASESDAHDDSILKMSMISDVSMTEEN